MPLNEVEIKRRQTAKDKESLQTKVSITKKWEM